MPKRIVSKKEKGDRRRTEKAFRYLRNHWNRKECQWEFDKRLIVMEHALNFHKGRTTNRREFMKSVNQIDPGSAKVLVKMLNNEDPTEEIWKSLGL